MFRFNFAGIEASNESSDIVIITNRLKPLSYLCIGGKNFKHLNECNVFLKLGSGCLMLFFQVQGYT